MDYIEMLRHFSGVRLARTIGSVLALALGLVVAVSALLVVLRGANVPLPSIPHPEAYVAYGAAGVILFSALLIAVVRVIPFLMRHAAPKPRREEPVELSDLELKYSVSWALGLYRDEADNRCIIAILLGMAALTIVHFWG